MSDEPCTHANAVETAITHTAVGRKWMQEGPCSYCPDCRRWTTRTTRFYDGRFFASESGAREANEKYRATCKAMRQSWVAEHYPDHISAGAA